MTPGIQEIHTEPSLPRGNISAWAKFLPLTFFQIYLTASLLTFAFGPIEWQIDNPLILYLYVILGQCFVFMGYCFGSSSPPRSYCGRYAPIVLLKLSVICTLVLLPPTLAARNYAELSVVDALSDPAMAYRAKFDAEVSNLYLSVPRTLLSPVTHLFLPVGIVFWPRLTLPWRVLWGIGICGQITLAIYLGQAFGIFDIMLVLPWLIWLYLHHAGVRLSKTHCMTRPRFTMGGITASTITVAVVLFSFWYFYHSRASRVGEYRMVEATGWSEDLYGVALPESMEFSIYYVTRYWTLGYYGLSGCLELPFRWSGGVGHSIFLARYSAMFSPDFEAFEADTYPARLEAETGYSAFGYWHTAYPWLASDLSFPGALLFVGAMGFLLARAWVDSIHGENPYAIAFLTQILLFLYYLPANNLRMGNPEAAFAFWGLLIMWLFTRRRLAYSDIGSLRW